MTRIQTIQAREILDSRGIPTLEVDIRLMSGVNSRTAVPSGAQGLGPTILEARDGDPDRFFGMGVRRAVENVNSIIAPALHNQDTEDQASIDQLLIELEANHEEESLGVNSLLGVSLACARAFSLASGVPFYSSITRSDRATLMPVPMVNILDGGKHAPNNIDFQEFMIVPAGAENFTEAVRYSAEVFHMLRRVILEKGYHAGVGDQGGFAPDLQNHEEALSLLLKAIEQAGYKPGEDIYLALDVAANNLYREGRYTIANEGLFDVGSDEVIDFYEMLLDRYPILSIEDGLAPEDWEGWRKLTDRLGHRLQVVGDWLFHSNPEQLAIGIQRKIANSILIKPNEVGTVTQILQLIEQARNGSFTQILSHRSGDTCDPFLASLAVAAGTGMIKPGAMCRSERVAKYNELMRIEAQLDVQARWIGINAFPRGG